MTSSIIYPIQYLRAFAAIWVMLFHYSASQQSTSILQQFFQYGYVGVDIFFLISGFIICKTAATTKHSPYMFLLRRYIRIFFGFWAILITFLTLNYFCNPQPKYYNYYRSFLLLPQPFADNPITVIWSLKSELAFYSFVFIILLIPNKKRIIIISISMFLLISMLICHAALGIFETIEKYYSIFLYNPPFHWHVTPYLLEFVAGCAIYHYKPNITYPLIYAAILLFVAITFERYFLPKDYIITLHASFYRVILFLPFSALLLIATLKYHHQPKWFIARAFAKIGDASFSLYLWHLPLLVIAQNWYPNILIIDNNISLSLALIGCFAIIFSILWYDHVEKPIYKYATLLLDKYKNGGA